jgi:hypothetical protein
LNLYGFELINTGPARGGYYHELFVKDRAELCRRMRRVAVKVVSQTTKEGDKGSREAKGDDQVKGGEDIGNSFQEQDELPGKGIGAPELSD